MKSQTAIAVVFAAALAGGMSSEAAVVPAGVGLALQPAGAAQPARIVGMLRVQDGHFLVDDEKTGKTVEVQGRDLEKYVGKRVEINGSMLPQAKPAAGATSVVRVVNIRAAKAAAAGIGTGAKLGIGAAIAGGTATGVAVAVTKDKEEKPPVSR